MTEYKLTFSIERTEYSTATKVIEDEWQKQLIL